MKKLIGSVLSVLMVILAFGITAFFYLHFDLEGILWDSQEQTAVTAKQIKKARGKKDFTGREAGEGIKELKTKKSWKKLKAGSGYAAIKPLYINETGVYGLGRWSDYYTVKKKGKSKEKKKEEKKTEAIQPVVDYSTQYSPFYIVALPDGTKILAQVNRGLAKKISKGISKGKEVQLPIGKKIAVSRDARELLKEQCKIEGVSTKLVFYAIDDEWEGKNADAVFWGKIGITIFVFIVATILLQLIKKAYVTEMFRLQSKEQKEREEGDDGEETVKGTKADIRRAKREAKKKANQAEVENLLRLAEEYSRKQEDEQSGKPEDAYSGNREDEFD